MDEERLSEAESIFQEAADLPPDQREPILSKLCAGDARLRSLVEGFLADHDSGMGSFLQPPSAATTVPSDTGEISLRIGSYEILRKIGEGGMGEVYEARQESPRRIVALKVIRSEALGREAARRFRFEAQVHGQLNHPGIAQVYEAGEADTEQGPRPYFAMELVRGRPLLDYVRESNLGMRERLELIAKICDAVEHAHRKGVLHRDLKPGNILVSGTDEASGQPKVLDFGVARAIHSDVQLTTMHTRIGQLVGTLAYMSPEQVSGQACDLDERSDVYQLGLILYEVLAGRHPYEVENLSVPEAGRVIQEEEPARLSSTDTSFRGDIETIAAKALEKERDRRYSSAAALAEDIRRYLADQPIVARPPSTVYRLRKYVKRRRDLILSLGAATALAAAVAMLWQGRGGRILTSEPLELKARRLTGLPRELSPNVGALSPDGDRLAYIDPDGLHVLTIESGEMNDLPTPEGHRPVNVSWFPSADSLLTLEFVDGDICAEIISSATGARLGRLPLSGLRVNASLSPSGSRLLGTRHDVLWVSNLDGTDQRVIVDTEGEKIFPPTWGPDDSRIAYYVGAALDRPSRLETVDLEGNRSVLFDADPLIRPAQGDRSLCWLPDGRLVYTRQIASTTQDDYEFWSIDVDPVSGETRGKPMRLVGWTESVLMTPSASRDGRRLAFRRSSGWTGAPYSLEIGPDGSPQGEPRRLSSSDWTDRVACWPNPDRFVFHSERSGNQDIYARRVGDPVPELLVGGPQQEVESCLTPDRTSLIFQRSWTDPQRQEFWILPLGGGQPRFLFEAADGGVDCARAPGARCIFFEPREDTLIVHELDEGYRPGAEILRLEIDPGVYRIGVRLSPDGEKLLVIDSALRTRVVDLSSGLAREIAQQHAVQYGEWSVDARHVFLTSMDARGPAFRLICLDLQTATPRVIFESISEWLSYPRICPDGRNLAFTAFSWDADFWMIEDY